MKISWKNVHKIIFKETNDLTKNILARHTEIPQTSPRNAKGCFRLARTDIGMKLAYDLCVC